MAQYRAETTVPRVSAWAVGGITFAGSMLVLAGAFQTFAGLAAIFDDQFFVVARGYAFDLDVTAWGWIHLILGILLITTGFALFAGRVWAAVTAVVLAMISALANFFFIPYYPFWAVLVIALDVWVIWAITRPGAVRVPE